METKKFFYYGLGSCLAIGNLHAEAEKTVENKPNVLFIIMDDMCDWTHFLGGNNQALTPNLDKLAARGVNFLNAYTAVPLSNPSRCAMLTGKQPFETGVYNNDMVIANYPEANNSLMMPQHFKNNGYTTICSGKIFHTKPSTDVLTNMWDDMENIDGGYGPFIKNSVLPANIKEKWRDYEAWTGPDTDFPDVVNSQKIIDFLGQTHDKPFFAAMGFYRPHNPYTAPKRYFDMYDLSQIKRPLIQGNDLSDIPQYAIDNFIGAAERDKTKLISETGNCWEQLIRAYLACVSFSDDRIGMILDALEKSAYSDNTFIVLIGDNGFHHGEKERWGKSALWREACHVPFLVIPPKGDTRFSQGTSSTVVNLIDIYPTLIEACNLPKVENQLAGRSLMPLLSDLNAEWDKPTISTFLPGNFSIRTNDWNFIKYKNNSYELYKIKEDENEFVNLANNAQYASFVDSLSSFLPATWYTMTSDSVVNAISEDFSSEEWDAEFFKFNPTYTRPDLGSNFSLNSTGLYMGKYSFKGAVVTSASNPNCALSGTIHGNNTSAVAFRFANTGANSYFELPKMTSAGLLTMHVRNGNTTANTTLTLQGKFNDDEDWTTIQELTVKNSNSYSSTSIDEIISYPANINEEVKLRIHGGNKFVQLFKIEVSSYQPNAFETIEMNPVKIRGRRIVVSEPMNISVYNSIGKLVLQKKIKDEFELPVSMGYGLFLIKHDKGVNKIIL